MVMVRYEQANFSQGELSPLVYARTDAEWYYKGAKKLRNTMVIPQGGFQKRWGTLFVDTSATNNPNGIRGCTLKIEQATYLIEFGPGVMYVYLENKLLAGPIVTPYQLEDIQALNFTQVRNRLIIANINFPPYQLVLNSAAATPVTFVSALLLTAATGLVASRIGAVYFSGNAPVPSGGARRLYINRVYYIRATLNNSRFSVFDTPEDAAANINPFSFSAVPGGTLLNVYRTFVLSEINFQNKPTYDFTGGYAGITFTPNATFGTVPVPLVLTASQNIFTAQHVGGIFSGNGGILRITAFTSGTVVSGYTIKDFLNLNPISGAISKLTEPVWSSGGAAPRGNPRCVKTFENRLWFFGSVLLPNGVWSSLIEEYYNFDDSERLDDNGISWYPESGKSNIITSVTAANSLIVHTDTAVYSTATFSEIGLTPTNFVLKIQDGDGVSPFISPVSVDNQIIYVDKSGNNVKNLIWDTGQSKYVMNNISVKANHLIKKPVDMEVFTNPNFINGSLCLFINQDGSLAVLQTMIQEGIGAYSSADTQVISSANVTTPSKFIRMVSSGERLWFWIQRRINGVDVVNIEEMNFNVKGDSAYSFTTQSLENTVFGLRGASVSLLVNGFVVHNATVSGDGILNLPPDTVLPATVIVGHGYRAQFMPLPIATIPGTPSSLYGKQHIREIRINYFETIGMTINGNEILTQTLPVPFLPGLPLPSGISAPYTPGVGWDPFQSDILIEQADPLPMTILAISYTEEV